MPKGKTEARAWIDENYEDLRNVARVIWERPEVELEEEFASGLQANMLERVGFDVTRGLAGLPTAFVAEAGSGEPTIGILGEYDALPGLSQKVQAEEEPLEEGGAGHGCGHNLLGTAGVGAAIAVKRVLDAGTGSGTVRYYGCPAEETLLGKVLLAKDGAFDDLDAALTWHPMNTNAPWMAESLAMNSVQFNFEGTSAHASAAPERGRSALDAVELMNTGANYLREHVPDPVRLHYSIVEGGGKPNIVPKEAAVWYYVRAPSRQRVESVTERLEKVAEGAATMTETTVETEYRAGCYDTLPNGVLGSTILENMAEIGEVGFSEEEYELARDLRRTVDDVEETMRRQGVPDDIIETELHGTPVDEIYDEGEQFTASTDVGDVSWNVPLGQFTAAAWPIGVSAHSWQSTAASGSEIGYKAMRFASKVLASTAIDLFRDEAILENATREFEAATEGSDYTAPLPEDFVSPT